MYLTIFDLYSTDHTALATLQAQATARLAQAYRPSTRAHLRHAMRTFLGFTVEFDIDMHRLQEHDILCYIESLVIKGLKYKSIVTHMSLLKNCFHNYYLPFELIESHNVKLMLRACSLTMDFRPVIKGIFTVQILNDIIRTCSILGQPFMYRCIFLIAFFGFLRISNCVPRSGRSFDLFRQLARGDILLTHPGLQIVVKWTKTVQKCNTFKTIPIGTIPGSPLCPISAFLAYTRRFPARDNHPMFYFHGHSGKVVIATELHVRTALATVLRALHLDTKQYGFHTFRRSGATLAYNMGVPLQDIQQHGMWVSDAVWAYIKPTPTQTNVTRAFTTLATAT